MRLMSFMLTTRQVEARAKTVTRRLGWSNLEAGATVWAIEKGQGLAKGEKVRRLVQIEILEVRRERLDRLLHETAYGLEELRLEGFGLEVLAPLGLIGPTTPAEFVDLFCQANHCEPSALVNRIAFRYVEPADLMAALRAGLGKLAGATVSCPGAGDPPAKEGR